MDKPIRVRNNRTGEELWAYEETALGFMYKRPLWPMTGGAPEYLLKKPHWERVECSNMEGFLQS